MMVKMGQCFVVGLLLAAFCDAACSNDAGCSYNGVCTANICECIDGWKGDACATLDLLPLNKSKWGYNEIPDKVRTEFKKPRFFCHAVSLSMCPQVGSWGGTVAKDAAGIYHMFVSEIANECGMNSWERNSQVRHATSTSPEGPYSPKSMLFGPFAHEPKVVVAPTGEFVLYFTARVVGGNVTAQANGVCDCRTSAAARWLSCGQASAGSADPTWMTYTSTPDDDASWSTPELIIDPFEYDSIDTNFSPVILPDGSLKVNRPQTQTRNRVTQAPNARFFFRVCLVVQQDFLTFPNGWY
jgi:hypothetical protein